MVRVTVNSPMRVFPQGQCLELSARQVVEGELAAWLIDSQCDVTVDVDDRPKLSAGEHVLAAETAKGLTATLTASASLQHDTAAKGAKTTKS